MDYSIWSIELIKILLSTYKENFMTQRATTYNNFEVSQRHTTRTLFKQGQVRVP